MIEVRGRDAWGAKAPESVKKMHPSRRDRIFVHWPAMPGHLSDIQMLQSAQRFHMTTLGWSDIAYTVALGTDGTMYVLRGVGVAGGHTRGENDDSYAILVLTGTDEKPTQAQVDAFPHVVEWLRTEDPLLGEREDVVVVGHRHDDEASTACPGDDWAEFALNYKHSRDYPGTTKEVPVMDDTTELVEKLYRDILGREADPEGLAYWVGILEGGSSVGAVSHEFLTVRLAADKAVVDAIAARITNQRPGGLDVEKAAEEAYRLFLENLSALKAE